MASQALLVSLLSPMVLAFVLGVFASRVKSDLKFPDELYVGLTMYLLIAIGMKGGYKLSLTSFAEFWKPGMAAILLSCSIPLWVYFILKKLGRIDVPNAAALAAHYGSVSAVTFSEALAFHDNLRAELVARAGALAPDALETMLVKAGASYEGFMPTLLALMEVPAILVAVLLARLASRRAEPQGSEASFGEILRELLAGKSSILLIGFLLIGFVTGKRGWEQVSPVFDGLFRGVLTVFLLEAGLVTGRRISDLRKVGPFLVAFGIVMPVLHAALGIAVGHWAGLSMGGATVLGTLAASASYIAAPTACRVALPQSNPTLYLTASLAITFPFNITVGLPLYHYIAQLIYGGA
jgi:uncharacterized protein